MKKSFTLKAFAFGAAATVALAASATPHSFLVKNAEMATKTSQFAKAPKLLTEKPEIQMVNVKLTPAVAQTTTSKAPAKKADANYGDWSEAGEGVFTYACLGDGESTSPYSVRQDNANEGNFQLKAYYGKSYYTTSGSEAIITVTANEDGTYTALLPTEGVAIGLNGKVTSDLITPLYVYDIVGYYTNLKNKGFTYSDGSTIEDDDIEYVRQYCTYDPETGTASFPCTVTASFDCTDQYGGYYLWGYYWGENNAYESFRRVGDGFKYYGIELGEDAAYFSHAQGATTGTYNINVVKNDNVEIAFRMLTGKKTGTALSTALQTLVNDLAESVPDDVCDMTEDGLAVVPVTSYRKGTYTLIYVYTDGVADSDGNVSYYGSSVSLRATQEDVDYYDAGMTSFTDASMYDALPVVFGEDTYEDLQQAFIDDLGVELPDTYTVTVPCQANSKSEGSYRLVHPYAEYYNNYLASQLEYDPTVDYLIYNVSDPAKSYIEPCATGIYFNTSSSGYIMMVYGSTNKMTTDNTASDDVWGTYADGVLSFDEVVIPNGATSEYECTGALSWSQATYDADAGTVTYKDWSSLMWNPEICNIGGEAAGINSVTADAVNDLNAPVEYFNLQGMRVANPVAGQLLIQRQGSKATKVIIR